MLQCVAVCYSVLHCVVVRCSMLQCVAVCCSVLQCVAVCCSVLQCVAAVDRCCTHTLARVAVCYESVMVVDSNAFMHAFMCMTRLIHVT